MIFFCKLNIILIANWRKLLDDSLVVRSVYSLTSSHKFKLLLRHEKKKTAYWLWKICFSDVVQNNATW